MNDKTLAGKKVLVANRGEIAVRIIQACKDMGLKTVLVYSEADQESMGVKLADETVCIGPAAAAESYLNIQKIIDAVKETGADAIHPGYGFLAENANLPQACEDNGITFIGPKAEVMRQLGDKISARALAQKAKVPMATGSEGLASFEDVEAAVEKAGFPAIFKAAAGGGGRGMRIVHEEKDLKAAFVMATNEAQTAFGDPRLFVESFIKNARHVEVQVMGDDFGNVVHIGMRDCSPQRRNQKVIEEAPPYHLSEELGNRILESAVALCAGVGYSGAGTAEFLVDKDREAFYFMEVNTRIQVEHPVSEEISGIDLIKEQIRVGFGEQLSFTQQDITFEGAAIECRITAEDPRDDFFPSPGVIENFAVPTGDHVRVDTHCYSGYEVSPYYDSMIAKLITTGETREEAIKHMIDALDAFVIEGIATNITFQKFLLEQPEFVAGDIDIKWIENSVLPKF